MSYATDFIAGVERACEWGVSDEQSYVAEDWVWLEELKHDNRMMTTIETGKRTIVPFVVRKFYEATGGYRRHASTCHLASKAVADILTDAFQMPTWLTFGAIYYNGLNVYNVTVSSMREIVKRGFELTKLDLHCWITLADMSIVDVTVLSSLHQKGLLNDNLSDETAYIIQDGETQDRLRYEPILVSDAFVNHIDRPFRAPVST